MYDKLKECCNNCRNNLNLVKFDYSQGGCVHTPYEGFCCLALASDGVAVHMVGGDSNEDVCEVFSPKKELSNS